jgi:ATP-binding cassette, subfamily B, bacterial
VTARLRRARRTVQLVFTDGFRAAPVFMALTLLFTVLAAVALVAYVIGFKTMTDAVVAGRPGELVVGVVEVAVLFTLGWAFQLIGASEQAGLTDRVALYQRTQIATLVAREPTIEHFERPDYQNELDLLQDNARLLGAGPGQVLNVLQTVLTTATIVVLLAVINPVLLVLPLFGIPPVLANRWSVRLRDRADESVAEQRRLANELFTLAATAGPAKELRLSGLQDELRTRHEALSRQVIAATTRATLPGTAASAAGWLLFAAGFVGGIVIIVLGSSHGDISVGQVVLVVSLLRRAQLQVGLSANLAGQLTTIVRTARRFQWLEEFARDHASPPAAAAPPDALRRGITLEGVVFRYPGTDAEVLRSIDLTLPAGATVALVGENGAGKTTIVKLLCGMYRPDAGVVRIEGTDLRELDLDGWRGRTSATFQDFVRYELPAGQTVGIGDLPRLDDAEAIGAALARASAADVLGELRQGLATPLGRSFADGQDLSGGQWQKLALGRGMMRDRPLLVILDEPTASLDAPTEHAIFERSMTQAKRVAAAAGAVTLLISHRFSTVRMADLIVVLEDGRILEHGSHRDLLRAGGKYAELFQLQARAYR